MPVLGDKERIVGGDIWSDLPGALAKGLTPSTQHVVLAGAKKTIGQTFVSTATVHSASLEIVYHPFSNPLSTLNCYYSL